MTFTDKASYLAYRAKWKADYRALADRIRALKRCRKHSAVGTEHYERVRESEGNQYGFYPQCLAEIFGRKATKLLEELALAKIEAQRQYLATRAAVAA